ncbi:MAG: hypothetical protein KBT27_09365 [Prevotellaceae bacterium]|nr:hypothetical protein [Candidatus Faecinaster equi]
MRKTAKETVIETTVSVTQVTRKKFPVNKSKKSYEEDSKRLMKKILELIKQSDDPDLDTVSDICIRTNENGHLEVQIFQTEVIIDELN